MGLLGKLLGRGARSGHRPERQEPVLINAYATVRDLPPLGFAHQWHNQRDLSDPELAEHLDGFAGYVMSRHGDQMTTARYHLWRHIQRVRHQVSFSVEADHLGAIEGWAVAANAILFLPDGSIRAPDGAALLTGAGETDPGAALPYPADAVARREATLARLANLEPRPLAQMPPVLGEAEVVLRPASEALRRALALCCVAVHAEAVETDESDIRPALREFNPVGMASLTPQEKAFIEAASPDAQIALQMRWRYEALNLLLWALGDEAGGIARSDVAADPAKMARAARALALKGEASESSLRPTADILDALDRTWREQWVVRQAQQDGVQPVGLDPGVVMERHVALNWLTGFNNEPGTGWDDIDTPS
jgi:hypothetical protein